MSVRTKEAWLGRTVPFNVNGKLYWPPCRGVYFQVAGTGYAVHVWASAAGVTHRMRRLMRTANARAGEEVIPNEEINKLSSKSLRIAIRMESFQCQSVPWSSLLIERRSSTNLVTC